MTLRGCRAALNWICVLWLSVLTSPSLAQPADTWRGVPFVTLRDKLEDTDRGAAYGDDRGTLKAGRCLLDETSLDFLSPAADLAPFHIPEEILRVRRVDEEPLASLLDGFATAPVIYMHGYYIDFDKGCRRATILKERANLSDRFLWFSWPSDGTLLNYAKDEANLYWSIPDFARVISQIHDRFEGQKLSLMGHSLGGRGVTLALYELTHAHPDLRFDNVVLLAPDMDFDLFAKLLPRIRPSAERITIYTSDTDRALAVSAQLHGYPRLGQSGNDVGRLMGVEVIDTSDLPTLSPNGHLYHIQNEEVGQDLEQLLNLGLPAAQRRRMVQDGPNLWRLQPQD